MNIKAGEPVPAMKLFLVGDASDIVRVVLETEAAAGVRALVEATVQRPARGKVWVAVFSGPEPDKQIWRSTGLRNYRQALKLALKWEREARAARQARKLERRPALLRVPRHLAAQGDFISPNRPLTQAEVAALLRISSRAVARAERSAIAKLRRDPIIRDLIRAYFGKELEENRLAYEPFEVIMTQEEITALRSLAVSVRELALINRLLALIGAE